MNVVYNRYGVRVAHGDNLAVLAELDDASVDAVITDPPYGLGTHSPAAVTTALTAWANGDRERVPDGRGFMGQEWDSFVPPPAVWDECLRVLKPGGHLACFAGSRTLDLMTLSVRMAGFEIRDTIAAWLYSSGFAKSLDVSKAIDKVGGAEPRMQASILRQARIRARMSRDAVAEAVGCSERSIETWEEGRSRAAGLTREFIIPSAEFRGRLADLLGYSVDERAIAGVGRKAGPLHGYGHGEITYGDAHTEAAKRWDGWGTALAPSYEPIILARKPLSGTVAQTVLEHGTGGLNIAATRTGAGSRVPGGGGWAAHQVETTEGWDRPYVNGVEKTEGHASGRWPKNVVLAHHPSCSDVCHPDCHVRALDEQTGTLTSGKMMPTRPAPSQRGTFGQDAADGWTTMETYGDSGCGSRFFPTFRYEAKAPSSERPQVDGVAHPTVKPLALMRWLVRLLTPPGGLVLDCFAGSGTTGQAARAEGFRAVLVEELPRPDRPIDPVKNPNYIALIKARLDARDRTPAKATGEVSGDEPVDLLDLLESEATA